MKKQSRKRLAIFVVAMMLVGILAACGGPASGSGSGSSLPSTELEELGSGDVKWSEEETSDGWMRVTNEGGATLGYSKDSGVSLLQSGGFAFKDLNRNGELDPYEDWRLDDATRAIDLASRLSGEEIAPLLTHGGWRSFGNSIDGTDLEYIEAGGRAGVTRSASNEGNTTTAVAWTNALQQLAEATGGYGIPITISVDPDHVSNTVDQLSLASTMDTELAHLLGVELGKQYRSVGITMLLGPQVDIATSPVWSRASGTYGEDPALSRDLAAAFVDGLQSTYDGNGSDLGWGDESVVAIAKHFVGAGASEGGRNDHFNPGKYTVFPGNGFAAHLISFFDGAFNLEGATGAAGGLMPNYAISYSTDGSLGELVAGAYSEFKINLLRDNGYDGFILTDWGVVTTQAFGAAIEEMTEAERFAALFKLGNDQIGGSDDTVNAIEGYKLMVADMGEEAALAQVRDSARRFFITQLEVGLFENPYVTTENATSSIWTDEAKALGVETQRQSIIMLKNTDNTIHAYDASAEKATVYIPYTYKASGNPWMGYTYSCEPVVDIELAGRYYNVVTDSVGEPSGTDDDGKAIYVAEDIIRASAADIASCDYAFVSMTAPIVDSSYNEESDSWTPPSIQYEPYTANAPTVRQESIAGDITMVEAETVYGTVTQEAQENRSYYGNTSALPSSYADYQTLLYVDSVVSDDCRVVVLMAAQAPLVWSEVEPLADAILLHYGVAGFAGKWFSDEALMDVVVGQYEPNGLLPMQQPASMSVVEAQNEDVPRDMECYVDANGNTYDFTFGLNWSGVINDGRVATYNVPALTTPATISFPS